MISEQAFVLSIAVIVVTLVAAFQLGKNRHRIKHAILSRLRLGSTALNRKSGDGEQPADGSGAAAMTAEESRIELERLQKIIEHRKKIAVNTDISHHLWGLYRSLLRYTKPHSAARNTWDGEWYDVEILRVSAENGLSKIEFKLKGDRYTFVDNEEQQGWGDRTKNFALSLYDNSDRCLIEIPMRLKVDSEGRNYAILSGGPNAFLPGGWINDFIHVKLKHESIRNQEIRAQMHQARLSEIEDLKKRFGISD